MAIENYTPNYDFTGIAGTDAIDIAQDVNRLATEVDAAIKGVSDDAAAAVDDAKEEIDGNLNEQMRSLELNRLIDFALPNGASVYICDWNPDIVEKITVSSYPGGFSGKPYFKFAEGTGQIDLNFHFKTTEQIAFGTRLFTGLPKHGGTAQSLGYTIQLFDNDGNYTGTRRCFLDGDGGIYCETLIGANINVVANSTTKLTIRGEFNARRFANPTYPTVGDPYYEMTETIAAQAAAKYLTYAGRFPYSNDRYWRTRCEDPNNTTGSDCSGTIWCAYAAVGYVLPNLADSQGCYGDVVAFARPGEELDYTNCKPGDIISLMKPGDGIIHHSALVIRGGSNPLVYDQPGGSRQSAAGGLGPIEYDHPKIRAMQEYRIVTRYWRDPDTIIPKPSYSGTD